MDIWRQVTAFSKSGSYGGFWTALEIWLNKPHVINRRLCGTIDHLHKELPAVSVKQPLEALITHLENNWQDFVDVKQIDPAVKLHITTADCETVEGEFGIHIIVRDLLPKQVDRYHGLRELVILDKHNGVAVFLPLVTLTVEGPLKSHDIAFKITVQPHEKGCLDYTLSVYREETTGTLGCTLQWLQDQLMRKLVQWSNEKELHTAVTSLKLIDVCRYNQRYHELKQKYGLDLVKEWPECTDPQKFVFEDIAIAAYLLTLWEDERQQLGINKKQTFVDLGCGNGLLVYLLTMEGHAGIGIDVRRRNIWSMFEPQTKLQESTIVPSRETLFPGYDWLIGNHSDELTPWIPVMAARSSYSCRYFVLPCCSFDFDAKFAGKQAGVSQYRCYLNFVANVGQECGFHVTEDTLRIPSTKRVCFIGQKRNYPQHMEEEMDRHRTEYILSRCRNGTHPVNTETTTPLYHDQHKHNTSGECLVKAQSCEVNQLPEGSCDSCREVGDMEELGSNTRHSSGAGNSSKQEAHNAVKGTSWAAGFQARTSEDATRHRLKVGQNIKDLTTKTVFDKLLSVSDAEICTLPDGRRWNKGGSLQLSDVADLLGTELLQKMKSECGGIQSLLRNCNHIFRVQAGHVHLRDWGAEDEYWKVQKRIQRSKSSDIVKFYKTKLCWFHAHHPEGCPRAAGQCCFAHGIEELKPLAPVR